MDHSKRTLEYLFTYFKKHRKCKDDIHVENTTVSEGSLTVSNLTKKSKLVITIKDLEKKVIVETYQDREPKAFNLGLGPELIVTTHIRHDDDLDLLKLCAEGLDDMINMDTVCSLYEKLHGALLIKASQCDFSDLHESEVIYFQIKSIEDLKFSVIELNNGFKIDLNPVYDKYRFDTSLISGNLYVVYNLRKECFVFNQLDFQNNFYIYSR